MCPQANTKKRFRLVQFEGSPEECRHEFERFYDVLDFIRKSGEPGIIYDQRSAPQQPFTRWHCDAQGQIEKFDD